MSMKNIPLADKNTYLTLLTQATEKFIRNLRWRAFYYLNENTSGKGKMNFGFKSIKAPPQVPELKLLEDELLKLIKNIEFNHQNTMFQQGLKLKVDQIKKESRMIVKADKTSNHYLMGQETYTELLDKHIQKEYKKEKEEKINVTNTNHIEIVNRWEIQDRVFETTPRQAFITMKDHKEAFVNKPTCRLLNPAKPEIGRISKKILSRINRAVRDSTDLTQWKNSEETIEWFKKIKNKKNGSFIQFDICNFYPSISNELLKNALDFAEQYTTISLLDRETIMNARSCLLYNKGKPWSKKENPDFDVTMGAWDGAECCDLVGLFMLDQLHGLNFDAGLYRDDGLGVSYSTPRQVEQTKKEICRIFRNHGLSITIEANKKHVNFLDISMDLNEGVFKPFMKENDVPCYVHCKSNHPPSIIKNIPLSINKRLSAISANEKIFNDAAPVYQDALEKSGYDYQLRYEPPKTDMKKDRRKRNRRRTITWFNPPYSQNVKTNVGGKFLKLIDQCFPKGSILGKIFNKNTIKISYSCLPNLENIVSNHNAKIFNPPRTEEEKTCNCRKNMNCPMDGKCLTNNIVYQAVVATSTGKKESYIGLTSNSFKQRWQQHKSSFNIKSKRNETTLSQYIWKLKDKEVDYNLTWKIVGKANPFSPVSERCNLCLKEKFFIIFRPEMCTLNTRNELATHCRHKKKRLLDKT